MRLAVIDEYGGLGARPAAPLARTVLDYFLLGKLPAGMTEPTPEDDEAEQEESD
jgi:penicillin-binding protein 2